MCTSMCDRPCSPKCGPYTPTTEEVWSAYINWEYGGPGTEFDRWLAEVKAQAWEEGIQQVETDGWIADDQVAWWKERNPYRQGETE